MGEILNDAVMQVMTPSLAWYDKQALAHVSKFADDYTGDLIDRQGQFRRGCIGLINHIPVEAYEVPFWHEPKYPLARCIDSLVDKGWPKRVTGLPELDGAMMINTSRLVRLMDVSETEIAQNQHIIEWEVDEDGNDIDPPCQDFRDPDFLPFVRWADKEFIGDFGSTLSDDVSAATERLLSAHFEVERDHGWKETNPGRWPRAIMDWKELKTADGFTLPEQWKVDAHDC